MFTNLKISSKIIILILSLVTLTVILESLVSYVENRELIKKGTIEKFNVVNNDNEEKIIEYFDNIFVGLNTFVDQPHFKKSFQQLNEAKDESKSKDSIRKIFKNEIFSSMKLNYGFENIYIVNNNKLTIFNYQNSLHNDEEFRNIDNSIIALAGKKNNVNHLILENKKFYNYISVPIKYKKGSALLICKIDICKTLQETIFKNNGTGNSFEQIAYKVNKSDFYLFNCDDNEKGDYRTERNYTKGNFSTDPENKIGYCNKIFPVGTGEYKNDGKTIVASWRYIPLLGLAILIQQEESKVYASQETFNDYTILFGFLIITTSLVFSFLFSRILTYPLLRLKKVLKLVSNGILPKELHSPLKDEIGEMVEIMNKIVSSMKNTAQFAGKIGKGQFEANFQPISQKDTLGKALLEMKESLITANKQDKLRNWIVSGVAEIGEVLRGNDSIEGLGDEILKYSCEKIDAVQGAFYSIQQEVNRPLLTITSSYAYNRKKYLKKSFEFGEGLVGQSAIEKEIIYRTEIPEDYVSITSGILGEQQPNSILIVPLITNDNVYGVLEFCSLQSFTSGQLKFMQEVSEIIARTIFNISNNERTRKLLTESQRLSSELQLQQEELRQNALEMEQTQEQLKKSNTNLEVQITEVNNAQIKTQALLENASEVITIYDKDGIIKYVSPSVENILGYHQKDLIGISDLKFIDEPSQVKFKSLFDKIMEDGSEQQEPIEINYFKKTGDKIWLEATAKNMLDNPAVQGIVFNSTDITEKIRAEVEERKRGQMQSLSENSLDLILRLNENGLIFYTNPTIKKLTGQSKDFFINKQINNVGLDKKTTESLLAVTQQVYQVKEKVAVEIDFQGINSKLIMQINAIPEFNDDQELETVLLVAHDITERKTQELELQEKNTKINDSINYAEDIQKSIIPDTSLIKNYFDEGFVLFKPRDIVSGDFPWLKKNGHYLYLAVVDCTGHGVPGAMISFVGYFLLNNIIDSYDNLDAGEVLNKLDHAVTDTFKQNDENSKLKDGMDLALCRIDLRTGETDYAGAHRPLYLVNGQGEIKELKGNKFPIGGGKSYTNKTSFTNHNFTPKKGESVYIFSDGFPDQFNPTNEKFGTKRIKEILNTSVDKNLNEIHKQFDSEFVSWKGDIKQTDDVLLIGFKY
jgi:PAS domain S-box-containing protein